MRVDRVVVLDWSAARGARQGRDSIWIGQADAAGVSAENPPHRGAAEARLGVIVAEALAKAERVLIGADFAFGFPAGFARRLTGRAEALAVWDWFAARVAETPGHGTTYRAAAAEANARMGGPGPFWGNGERVQTPGLPRLKPPLPAGLAEYRATDLAARAPGGGAPKPVWQLAGAGAVGAQVLTGLPMLARLRAAHPGRIAVWPFEPVGDAPVVLAEVYPSILAPEVAALKRASGMVADEAQVRLLAGALWRLAASGGLGAMLDAPRGRAEATEEGWILGAGHQAALRAAAAAPVEPPRLRNDCFAMPQGVAWVPVDEALARLRAVLVPLTGAEEVPLGQAAGRVLAEGVPARRANPPRANAAVDGWGFAAAGTGAGVQRLPVVPGRAAAGRPFAGVVPAGMAVRVLTGAILPEGVDTVVLDEDCARDGATVVFDGPVKPRINTRKAGEDVTEGALALAAGQRLRAPDLALLAAVGVDRVAVRRRLRVGVLSTGDEIVPPGADAAPHQIFDANRPMLMALAVGWGCEVVDLGHAPDDARRIAARLDRGAARADVILTSGGASAGDEDHVARLLRERGNLAAWRIAVKPGRPLALALWQGVPVFGLPGNPVAALVCALIFARPALALMAGEGWIEPQGFSVPAAFAKSKKAGRREYLRARLNAAGAAEVFASEGSGRVSGLAWAGGLVELPDAAVDVAPGDPVRFLPYASFGIG
jgi:molybdopterin molybdotransferase